MRCNEKYAFETTCEGSVKITSCFMRKDHKLEG